MLLSQNILTFSDSLYRHTTYKYDPVRVSHRSAHALMHIRYFVPTLYLTSICILTYTHMHNDLSESLWAEVEGRNVSGVALYPPWNLSLLWYNWSLQACVTLTPCPQPSSTFLFHLLCVDVWLRLDSWFSSCPAPLGFLYVLFLSLSPSRAPLPRLLLLARYPWPVSIPVTCFPDSWIFLSYMRRVEQEEEIVSLLFIG